MTTKYKPHQAMTDENEVIVGIKLPKKNPSIIMVLGVGGAGGNAVNHMYDLGITDVTFMVCNTDRQALNASPVPIKVQLGEGLGAGNDPNKGRQAAIESLDDIVLRFEQEGTKMVFVTAGMGGGTGTGAAPVIAKAARDRGILTVGIVTLPFHAEGRKRVDQANRGLEELRKNVDSLVVIHNDNIAKIYGSLPLEEAFGKADDILATAAKGIAELITREGNVNVDFADVKAVMTDGGMALMGSGRASGEDKIAKVTEAALSSPLLNHQEIKGARDILFNLSYSPGQISFDEATSVLEMIQRKASRGIGDPHSANIIWGAGVDPSLDDEIVLTIVATGFDNVNALGTQQGQQQAAERPATGGISIRRPQTADKRQRHPRPEDQPARRHRKIPRHPGLHTPQCPAHQRRPRQRQDIESLDEGRDRRTAAGGTARKRPVRPALTLRRPDTGTAANAASRYGTHREGTNTDEF